jgi:predicted 3-demethylubiquinone-9 3-methyltransferase (glyoxalase superfamily)
MVTPAPVPVPHVGGPITGPGCPTVLIGSMPAAVMGDLCVCVGPPSTIVMGSPNVLIGMAGGGGGGGGSSRSPNDATIQALKAGTIKPVQGSETLPVEVQAALVAVSQQLTPEEMKDAVAAAQNEQKEKKITIADFVEILKAVESEQGKEAARFYASTLDYSALSDLSRAYVNGENTDPKNDPNQMPTRFMILFGADDAKLREIDEHPDCANGEKHPINVANLRKGLKLLGYNVQEAGPYDNEVEVAHFQYISSAMPSDVLSGVEEDNSKIKKTIELRNEDGLPVPGARFQIWKNDRIIEEGKLNAYGKAFITMNIDDKYKVSFPEIV